MNKDDIALELGEQQEPAKPRKIEQVETDFIKLALKRAADWESKFGDAIERSKNEKRVVIEGDHWPEKLKKQREALNLPCLVLNHGIVHRDGVAGELLQNMPRGKYRGFDSGTDPKMAEIGTSLLRRIEANSNIEDIDAETVKMCLTTGYPAWQVVYSDFANARTFNQEIFVRFQPDQYSVMLDPNATALDTPDRGGPHWGMFIEDVAKAEYQRKYKGAQISDMKALGTEEKNWWTSDTVRVASYYVAEPRSIKLLLFEGNVVVEEGSKEHKKLLTEVKSALGKEPKPIKDRETIVYDILHYRISGIEILPNDEGKREGQKISCEYIPIIPWEGKYDYLNSGEKYYRGVFSNAIDSNKMLDLWASKAAENVATGVQHKGTVAMFKGHDDDWNNPVGKKILYYNVDSALPAGSSPQEVNSGSEISRDVDMMKFAGEEIKDLTNRHEASLGQQGNETSGRAILARQQQGNASNFEFPLNFARAIRYRTKIIESMIPGVYDYETAVRIIGDDGKEKRIEPINKAVAPGTALPEGSGTVIEGYLNNTSKARFDTVVDIGASFKTQRMESAQLMSDLAQSMPAVAEVISDLIIQANDFPLADEASKRLKFMLDQKMPGLTSSGADGNDPEQAKIKQAVEMAVKQLKAQIMPGLQVAEQKIMQQNDTIQQLQQAVAEKDRKLADATTLMKNKEQDYRMEDRKLALEERKVAIDEQKAQLEVQNTEQGGIHDEWNAAMKQTTASITSIDRALAIVVDHLSAANETKDDGKETADLIKAVQKELQPVTKQLFDMSKSMSEKPAPKSEKPQSLTVVIDNKGGKITKTVDLTGPDGEKYNAKVTEEQV